MTRDEAVERYHSPEQRAEDARRGALIKRAVGPAPWWPNGSAPDWLPPLTDDERAGWPA